MLQESTCGRVYAYRTIGRLLYEMLNKLGSQYLYVECRQFISIPAGSLNNSLHYVTNGSQLLGNVSVAAR